MLFTIEVGTKESVDVIDITERVQKLVWEAKVKRGIAVLFTRHTTTGLLINEYERGLVEDFKRKMAEIIPENGGYMHDRIDNNAHSHLRAGLLLQPEVVIPIEGGELMLGVWQRVLFVELDGPRHRRINVMLCPCPEGNTD